MASVASIEEAFSYKGLLVSQLKAWIEEKKKQYDDENGPEGESIDLAKFWAELYGMLDSMTKTSAKFCLLFSDGEFPDNASIKSICELMQSEGKLLHNHMMKFPKKYGASINSALIRGYEGAVKCTIQLIESAFDRKADVVSNTLNMVTGYTWSAYTRLSSLPRHNIEAALEILKQDGELMIDAIKELDEAIKNDHLLPAAGDLSSDDSDDEDDIPTHYKWSQEEKNVVGGVIGLMKAIKLLNKRLIEVFRERNTSAGCFDPSEENLSLWKEADAISEIDKDLHSMMDDLAISTYSEDHFEECSIHMRDAKSKVMSTVEKVNGSSFHTEELAKNLEFVLTAIKHNSIKFENHRKALIYLLTSGTMEHSVGREPTSTNMNGDNERQ